MELLPGQAKRSHQGEREGQGWRIWQVENSIPEQVAVPETRAGLSGVGGGEDQGWRIDQQSMHPLIIYFMNYHAIDCMHFYLYDVPIPVYNNKS